MKHIFKYIGIFSLLVFSFYYTDYIANFMRSKTELMRNIKADGNNKKVDSVNAIIKDDYIIPGLNGIIVNYEDSYQNMQKVGRFDENYLLYTEIIPTISLKDNLDKIIRKANPIKRAISLIIVDRDILNYSLKNNIKINYLINKNNRIIKDNVEIINDDSENFYEVESFLNKNNQNKNICVINIKNKDICQSNGKYLVEPTYIINNSNMTNIISEIDNGDIIKIDNLSLTNYIILINKIKYRDIKIDYLSNLISEKYSSL